MELRAIVQLPDTTNEQINISTSEGTLAITCSTCQCIGRMSMPPHISIQRENWFKLI